MKRREFIKAAIGVLAAPVVAKTLHAEPKPVRPDSFGYESFDLGEFKALDVAPKYKTSEGIQSLVNKTAQRYDSHAETVAKAMNKSLNEHMAKVLRG